MNRMIAGVRKAYGTARVPYACAAGRCARPTSCGPSSQPVTLKPFFFMSSTVALLHRVDRRAERGLLGDRLGERVLVGAVGDVHVGPEGEAGRGVRDLLGQRVEVGLVAEERRARFGQRRAGLGRRRGRVDAALADQAGGRGRVGVEPDRELAAAALCLDPRSPRWRSHPSYRSCCSPAVHCGSGAIVHLPAVSGALPDSTPGPRPRSARRSACRR